MAVYFFNEDIDMPQLDKRKLKDWVKKVVRSHDKIVGELNYIFTSDSYILKVNNDYLQHDYYTDVITFDYSEGNKISGDIFISLDTVKSNSILFKQDYDREFRRVLIHGVLHLLGFKDKKDEEVQEMRLQENNALALI